ncbi:LPS assembly lipoprotein LptE [Candidatus Omnitrophota bacterium]
MKKVRYFLSTVCVLYLVVFCGCGYTTRAYIGPYKTIYVAPFKNSVNIASASSEYSRYITYYPLLESTITQEIVDRFIFDGSLKIKKEKDADIILKGELIAYERNALRYAENNEDVTQYRVTLIINMGLYNAETGGKIWQKDSFAGDSSYHTTGTNATSEKSALDNAISDLARRVVEELVEAW